MPPRPQDGGAFLPGPDRGGPLNAGPPAEPDEGPLTTPDGRYLVVRGRLWRRSDPRVPEERRQELVADLMTARRDKGRALETGDAAAREDARQRVEAAKQGLGERGPVWWDDGTPDLTRHLARTTEYADWYAGQEPSEDA